MSTEQASKEPRELYPLEDLAWYQSLQSLQSYNVLSIESVEHLHGLGGYSAKMVRVILNVADRAGSEPYQLRLLAKILEKSNPILLSTREVPVYQDVMQPLTQDFTLNHAQDIELINKLLPDAYKKSTNMDSMLSQELFKIPFLYHGEINEETGGKFLLLGELFRDSSHAGNYFGDCPHNLGRDQEVSRLTAPFPTLSQIDITKKAFASIAKLHAKFWNNDYNNIPGYMSAYDWYLGTDCDAKEYDEFVTFGRNSWDTYFPKRTQSGVKFSQYLIDIVNATYKKSTFETFRDKYNRHSPNCSTPISIIHADFYPANTLISSSNNPTGTTFTNNTDNDKEKQPYLFIYDFELSCISAPSQDVTQWIIAQLDHKLLPAYETELLQYYYNQLEFYYLLYRAKLAPSTAPSISSLSEVYPFEQFYGDYVQSCAKWIWLVSVLASYDIFPDHFMQYFVDQLTNFLTLHGITPETAPILKR